MPRSSARPASLVASLAAASPSALALTKQLFYQLDGRSLEEGIALGARVNAAGPPDAGLPRRHRAVPRAMKLGTCAARVGLALAGFAVACWPWRSRTTGVGWAAIALLLGSLIVRLLQRSRANRPM